jgi:hypothetical protein
MLPTNDTLRPMIPRLMPSVADRVLKFHDDHADEICAARGSSHNHQNWSGGWHDHVVQCLTLAEGQYSFLTSYTLQGVNCYEPHQYRPDFQLADAALVLYFHDIEKIFKYGGKENRYHPELLENKNIWYYGILPEKYGIRFSDAELNALKYVHGEHDYSKTERKMKPLAAFCHVIDILSARIFFHERKLTRSDDSSHTVE